MRRLGARRGAAILAAVLLASCGGPISAEGITLFRYGLQTGGPAALIRGTLAFRDGCVLLRTEGQVLMVTHWTILWPPATDLRVVDGQLAVALDGEIAFHGDEVELGGGGQGDQAFVEQLVGPVGNCETETYWMATSLEVVGR
jgi:hypothetical protein